MYQNIYLKQINYNHYNVHLWDDEKGHQVFEWRKTAFVPDPYGEYTSLDGVKCKKTTYYHDSPQVYENDVPSDTQLLVELYGHTDEPATWQNRFYFDIEVSMEGQLPDPNEGNNPITSVAYYDETTQEYGVYILDEFNEVENRITDDYKLFRCDTEEELLDKFFSKWRECAPTVVTGWNIDFFDIPYLYNRAKRVMGTTFANNLSPVGIVEYNNRKERYFIAGVSCLDYLPIYKNFTYTQLSSYRLDNVGEFELGQGKVEYEGTLDQLKKNDIEKFIEYNLVDVKLIVDLENKLKFLEQTVGIASVGHVPYENIYSSSRFLEGSILCYLRRNGNRVANNRPPRTDDESKFMGAYVKQPKPGRYDYIFDLDLTSMYPSIIMSLNISPETKVGKVLDWDFKDYSSGKLTNIKVEIINDGVYEFDKEGFGEFLNDTKFSISSNGILYRTDVDGIIPKILRTWFDQRVEFKNLMKKFGNEGDDDKYNYYKKRQIIQKVLLNSIYGCLGLKGWRWYDVDNALAVTSVGQEVIKFSSDMANHYYNKRLNQNDDWVIYTDTDSTFLSAVPIIKHENPDIDVDDEKLMCSLIADVAQEVQNFINESYDVMAKRMFNLQGSHRFEIKQENIARRGIWISKKRYVQKIIWENGVTKDDIDYKGLDVVRSDFPKAFKTFMKSMLMDLLNGVEKDVVDSNLLDFKDSLTKRPFMEVGKPTGVKGIKKYSIRGGLSDVKKGTPAHVKSAIYYNNFLKEMGLEDKAPPITDGEKIVWLYLKQNPLNLDIMALKGSDDPQEVIDFISAYADYDKMFDRLLRKKILDFYEALDWESFENINLKANQFFSF